MVCIAFYSTRDACAVLEKIAGATGLLYAINDQLDLVGAERPFRENVENTMEKLWSRASASPMVWELSRSDQDVHVEDHGHGVDDGYPLISGE